MVRCDRSVAHKIDLHTHTTYSDGTFTPAELVAVARERGVGTLAVTDHDSTEGLPEAFAAADGTGMEIVPGVEFSTVRDGQGIHLLAYWPELDDDEFQAELRRLREDRLIRGERMVARLQDLGYPITFERVREIAEGGNIIRPHVAQALVEAGVVATIEDAFTPKLIAQGGRAYVEKHVSDQVIEELAEAGLYGIEAAHSDHPPQTEARYRAMATALGLVATGSSDCHGTRYDPVRVGLVTTDPEEFDRLRAKRSS
jgi:predicted metal-dependent phosphoesterase TrpH